MRKLLSVVLPLGLLTLAAWWWRPLPAPDQRSAGMVRLTETGVVSELPGRLAALHVAPGQRVAAGDLIAELEAPDLTARLSEAEAAAASAARQRDRLFAGARPEQIAIADQAVKAAEAQVALARSEQRRIERLAQEGADSPAKLDAAESLLAQARAALNAKQAQAVLAAAGPTAEQKAVAEAQVALAEARVAEVGARLAKTRILAPADGVITLRVAEPGEIVAAGQPVATLAADGAQWFSFVLREDRLNGLRVGGDATVEGPRGQTISATVAEIRPTGGFATWQAAKAVGDHDINSLRLRLQPKEAIDLEPGRTVWLK